jgi:hypothetical protein
MVALKGVMNVSFFNTPKVDTRKCQSFSQMQNVEKRRNSNTIGPIHFLVAVKKNPGAF